MIVATIGSIAKNAHLLGNIRCVVIDEAHLVNPDGAGQYRQFLNDLARYCVFRVVGFHCNAISRKRRLADRWRRTAIYRHRSRNTGI